ncbi:TonB-dependent siderophore receptor [Chlorogloeopsis sp. ULAP02]|uniref:TonB-dependent siderophore receptor n=1 Tax=Chlorogloeopsis sp. ULAP02 TaxID=3107926 RepID=UPI0031363AD6
MKLWQFSFGMRLWLIISLSGFLGTVATEPGLASEKLKNTNISQLGNIKFPATSAQMLVQQPAPSNATTGEVVAITGVKANPTDKGIEVVLETAQGEKLQVTNRSTGNNFIADITGGQLRLPDGNAFTFKSEKPIEGITEITVANIDVNTVRVTVVGEKTLPTVELFDDNTGLVFGIASAAIATSPPQQPQTPQTEEKPASETPQEEPLAQDDEPIELVVTGEQDSYRVPNTSVGTRTDTPLRDIPQSIQIVPQQVIEDQNVIYLQDALRNATGVVPSTAPDFSTNFFNIRGFSSTDFSGNILRNGLRDPRATIGFETTNVEQVEVLRGPASVLFGQGNPGGTINIITKQPLREPFYAIDATIGSFDFYRGAIDLSGPLNDSKTLLYRLNTSYRYSESFVDLVEARNFLIAPVVSLALGENTRLTFEGEYIDTSRTFSFGLPAVGTVLPNPNGRISRSLGINEGPSESQNIRVGYVLEHEFSENWSVRNAFRAGFWQVDDEYTFPSQLLPDNRTLERQLAEDLRTNNNYIFTTDLVGRFSTGSIEHQLLLGFDLSRIDETLRFGQSDPLPFDLFNPKYGQFFGSITRLEDIATRTDVLSIYVQDQITLIENLKLLLGGRFDLFRQTDQNFLADTRAEQSGDAFSPRVGIVYQPIEPISLYASYTRSFTPTIGTAFDGSTFQPERGTQYEIGVKADFNDKLSATLALYDLTRTNVTTDDTRAGIPPGFSIQTGKQRSQGVELTVQGEILPGWNIIAGYAYTNARLTKDNTFEEGNFLSNAPENAFNLWTTYEIQQGYLRGLGLGLGFFFVGERQADLANSFQLPSYFRTDAAIFYRRNQFRAALNFRNLFDVDYFESAFGSLRVYPGEPFTVQGTISWQF